MTPYLKLSVTRMARQGTTPVTPACTACGDERARGEGGERNGNGDATGTSHEHCDQVGILKHWENPTAHVDGKQTAPLGQLCACGAWRTRERSAARCTASALPLSLESASFFCCTSSTADRRAAFCASNTTSDTKTTRILQHSITPKHIAYFILNSEKYNVLQ